MLTLSGLTVLLARWNPQANQIEQQAIPRLREALARWKKQVLFSDLFIFGLLGIALVGMSIEFGYWEGLLFNPPWLASLDGNVVVTGIMLVAMLLVALAIHFLIRNKLAKRIAARLDKQESYGNLSRAFLKSTRMWRSIFQSSPAGWGKRTRQRLAGIRDATDRFVQYLNDRFTSPSGVKAKAESKSA